MSLQGDYTSGTWEEKTQEINFADFKFCISHNYLKQETSENESKEEPEEGSYSNAQKHITVDSIMMNECGFVPARLIAVRSYVVMCASYQLCQIMPEARVVGEHNVVIIYQGIL